MLGELMRPIRKRLKDLHASANQGWPTIWLQSAGGLLFLFGLLCVIRVRPDAFAFGAIFAFVQIFIPIEHLSSVGWGCVAAALILLIATVPAQRKKLVHFKRDQAMLQRQDWRK
jgi:hypothetical protein